MALYQRRSRAHCSAHVTDPGKRPSIHQEENVAETAILESHLYRHFQRYRVPSATPRWNSSYHHLAIRSALLRSQPKAD